MIKHKRLTIGVVIVAVYSFKIHIIKKCLTSLINAVNDEKQINLKIVISINSFPPGIKKDEYIYKIIEGTGYFPKFLFNAENLGFTGATNCGIEYISKKYHPDWVMVLNDDAFVHNNFFLGLSDYMENPNISLLSCKVLNMKKQVQSVGLDYYVTGLADVRKRDLRKNDNPLPLGCVFLISKKELERLYKKYGYIFDPIYFMYSEDLELSLRIMSNKGTIAISNKGLVTHMGSATNEADSLFQYYYSFRNWLITIFIWWPINKILLRMPFLLLGQLYVVFLCLKRGYIRLYPRIILWMWKNRVLLLSRRKLNIHGVTL